MCSYRHKGYGVKVHLADNGVLLDAVLAGEVGGDTGEGRADFLFVGWVHDDSILRYFGTRGFRPVEVGEEIEDEGELGIGELLYNCDGLDVAVFGGLEADGDGDFF